MKGWLGTPGAAFAVRGVLVIAAGAGLFTAAGVVGFLLGAAGDEALEIQLDEDHAGHTAPVT